MTNKFFKITEWYPWFLIELMQEEIKQPIEYCRTQDRRKAQLICNLLNDNIEKIKGSLKINNPQDAEQDYL